MNREVIPEIIKENAFAMAAIDWVEKNFDMLPKSTLEGIAQLDWANAFADTQINREKNPEHWARMKFAFNEGWTRACMQFRESGWLSPVDAENLVKNLNNEIVLLQSKVEELQEDLSNKKSGVPWMEDEEDDFSQPDPDCSSCGGKDGKHVKGCPDDDSPFALLQRRGFD